MKTKHTFEPSDFQGCGQMIVRNSSPPKSKDLGFAASVAYKIGYLPDSDSPNKCMISLQDGMVILFYNDAQLCEHLNRDEEGFRPMTKEEIAAIMAEIGNRF